MLRFRSLGLLVAIAMACDGVVGGGESADGERGAAALPPVTQPGTLRGTPTVSSDGSFGYEIELAVPPGTAGMAPSLALSYSSRADGSLLGVGWSLSGLSVVHRCPATLAQDGRRGQVALGADDRLCLDGKRLIAVQGSYGADATEYRLETEDSTRVASYGSTGGGPVWLRSWARTGQVFDYATTADSRIEVPGSSNVMTWAVSRITDAAGNTVDFKYTEDPTTGTFEPLRIDYTGNPAAGLAPYASVRFVTVPRPADDTPVAYVAGVRVKPARLLSEIQTFVGENRVRTVRLSYGQGEATRRTRLESISGCAGPVGSELCTPPTRFSWTDVPAAERTFVRTNHVWPGMPYVAYVLSIGGRDGDFDGDGRTDSAFPTMGGTPGTWTVCLAQAQGGHACSEWAVQFSNKPSETVAGDFNGDGRTDLANHNGKSWSVCLSTGTGFECGAWAGNQVFAAGVNNTLVGDYNGDGLTDLVSNAGKAWQWCLAQPNRSWSCSAVPGVGRETFESVPGDYNGDGRTDVAAYAGNGNWNVCLSNDTTWQCSAWKGHSGGVGNNEAADFNGDGRTDLAGYAGNGSWHVCLSTGTGFACSYQPGPARDAKNTIAADVNGDGRADLIAPIKGESWTVCLSRGETFGCETWKGHDRGLGFTRTVDLDGDAKADLTVPLGNKTVMSLRAPGLAPDLVSKVADGLDAETRVEYAPLSDAGVYEKGTGAVYPDVDLKIPIQVVKNVQTSTGVEAGLRTESFRYGGARARVDGRGVQGFAWRESTDAVSGERTLTRYRLDFPYTGLILSSETWFGSARHRRVTNTLVSLSLGGGRVFPHVSASRDERFEPSASGNPLVSTVDTSTVYDSYGNALRVEVAGSAGGVTRTKVSESSYDNLVTPNLWQLGRLRKTTVIASVSGGSTPQQVRFSSFTYDAAGMLASETVEPGAAIAMVTAYARDGFGNIVKKTTSGLGVAPRVVLTQYDPTGRFVIKESDALGRSVSQVTDARFGAVVESTDLGGRKTITTLDIAGRRQEERRPDNTTTRWTVLSCASQIVASPSCAYLIREEVTGGPWVLVTYDRLQREILRAQQGPSGRIIVGKDITFDADGRVQRSARPYFAGQAHHDTAMTYDALDRMLTETGPDGAVSASSYSGLATTVTDAAGHKTTRVVDVDGRVLSLTDAMGGVTHYTYDAMGSLRTITRASGAVTSFQWDARGRKTAMADPDLGTVTYEHDAFGQLVRQTDAKGQVTTTSYDAVGRPTKRVEPGLTSTWVYDSAPNGVGLLHRATTSAGVEQRLVYDALGRPFKDTRTLPGESSLVIETSYDAAGRRATTTFPSGLGVSYLYDAAGYLSEVQTKAGARIWNAGDRDAEGHITLANLGNGIAEHSVHDVRTGLLLSLTAVGPTGAKLVAQTFAHDVRKNLTRRDDLITNVAEVFAYDPLSRLTSSTVGKGTQVPGGTPTVALGYDAVGNILSKSDAGAYSYGSRLTAVKGAVNRSFTYDANGNVLSDGARTITLTSFDMPSRIAGATASVDYTYDAQHQRARAVFTKAGASTRVLYLNPRVDQGPSYEQSISSAGVVHRHYVHAAGRTVALITRKGTTDAIAHLHHDHLGSLVAVSDAGAKIVERLAYDAWGKRRHPDGAADPGNTIAPKTSSRGFTLHEHLDDLGLVHMNGRVYDPALGRFLSADPHLQSHENPLALNRYSYVFNNPLNNVDPSGYFSLSKFFKKILKSPILRTILSVVVAWCPYLNWAVAAFLSGVISSGGDFRAGVISVLTAGMFRAIGAGIRAAPGSLVKVVAHGIVGGLASMAGGGSFKSGFLSAAFGQAVAPFTVGHGKAMDLFLTTIAGGAGAVLGGGKFVNGAITAAFGRIFNDFAHPYKFAIGLFGDPVTQNPFMLQEFAKRIGAMTYMDLYPEGRLSQLQLDLDEAMRGASEIHFNAQGFRSGRWWDWMLEHRMTPRFDLNNVTNWELWRASTKYFSKLVIHAGAALGDVSLTLSTMVGEYQCAMGGMCNPFLVPTPATSCQPSDPWCA